MLARSFLRFHVKKSVINDYEEVLQSAILKDNDEFVEMLLDAGVHTKIDITKQQKLHNRLNPDHATILIPYIKNADELL